MIFHSESEERIYLTRIEQALSRLKSRYVTASVPLTAEVALPEGRPLFADRPIRGYRSIAEGEAWGKDWQTGWFHLTGIVPAAWAGQEVVVWIESIVQ